ncbi:hypothetical protein WA026_023541 [Henosepilachna vigintioctopunctata]|uniref:Uncharacterized protein n=1 Tax=Henosepilachna vigintioctopunctata TaxID=420089 RepID=A0AAW1USA7_9CUCU
MAAQFRTILMLLILQESVTSSQQDCGRSVRRSRQPRFGSIGRIIQGKQSVRGAWPWQVSSYKNFTIS